MRALVTGFEGFAGRMNPSGRIAKQLDGTKLGDLRIEGYELPEDFYKLPKIIGTLISEVKPDVVISTGWDYISKLSVERISLNVMNSKFGDRSVPDNYGNEPSGEHIIRAAPVAIRATFPAEEIVKDLHSMKIPAHVSYHAGTHCCNTVMYSVLYHTTRKRMKSIAGFIHVPPVPEMKLNSLGVKPMKFAKELKGIERALLTCQKYLHEQR